MKIKLPTWKKNIDEQTEKVVIVDKEIVVDIDTSIYAEQRWEVYFPTNAKNETLFAYIERIIACNKVDSANILSNLKALYCFIESDEIADFKTFLQLFDLSDVERIKRLVDKISNVFKLVLDGSATNSKN